MQAWTDAVSVGTEALTSAPLPLRAAHDDGGETDSVHALPEAISKGTR